MRVSTSGISSRQRPLKIFLVKLGAREIIDEVEEKDTTEDLRMGDSIYVQEIMGFIFILLKFHLLNAAH